MILFVSTGGVCRSPMAEGLLRRELKEIGSGLAVSSAGISAENGVSICGHIKQVLTDRGVEITNYRSQILTYKLVNDADLIVTMEQRHQVVVAALDQRARSRMFLVGEVVRLGSHLTVRNSDQTLQNWTALLNASRGGYMTTGRLVDEVLSPDKRFLENYRRIADRLQGICKNLTKFLAYLES
tara:strand:- start:233 stop:781 length:549 start_codon:yes stop_codon:yes gene_type:complete